MFARMLGLLLFGALLVGCGEEEPEVRAPLEVSDEATGHYCGMLLVDHEGPKGQIHLASQDEPLWFSSVRDTIAFTRLPEEPDDIVAIFVNDMGRASDWAQPEPDTWIEARSAWFVIESERVGGMGAPEAVPFSEQSAAETFVEQHGGRLVRLDDVPEDYVLGSVELPGAEAPAEEAQDHSNHSQH